MVLFIVLAILIVSFAIQQYRAGRWNSDRLREKDDGSHTYTDYFGVDRDRRTNEPRFIGVDISGDRVMYDKDHNIVKNFSEANEMGKFMSQIVEAKERGQKAIELDIIPSEKNNYPFMYKVRKKYKDVYTGANYIVIKGNDKRGMDLVHYYYDYENQKVIRPTDGFDKRFNDPNLCKVCNTKIFTKDNELTSEDIWKEVQLLQGDIDQNRLELSSICDNDEYYYRYFGERSISLKCKED